MWVSLNEVLRLEPRCPLVPNATCWSTSLGVGHTGVVGGDQVGDVDQVTGLGGLSGAGCCVCGCHGAILVPTASHVEDRHHGMKSRTHVEIRRDRPSSW